MERGPVGTRRLARVGAARDRPALEVGLESVGPDRHRRGVGLDAHDAHDLAAGGSAELVRRDLDQELCRLSEAHPVGHEREAALRAGALGQVRGHGRRERGVDDGQRMRERGDADELDVGQAARARVGDGEGQRAGLAVVQELVTVASRDRERGRRQDAQVRARDGSDRRARAHRPEAGRVRADGDDAVVVGAAVLEPDLGERGVGGFADLDLAEVAGEHAVGAVDVVCGRARDRVPCDHRALVESGRVDRRRDLGPPAQPLFTAAGVAQWISWRSKAARIAVMCGVPSDRSPLSSSTASRLR